MIGNLLIFPGREVSPEEQQLILDVHNRYRQAIALGKIRGQPTGSNMIEMVHFILFICVIV